MKRSWSCLVLSLTILVPRVDRFMDKSIQSPSVHCLPHDIKRHHVVNPSNPLSPLPSCSRKSALNDLFVQISFSLLAHHMTEVTVSSFLPDLVPLLLPLTPIHFFSSVFMTLLKSFYAFHLKCFESFFFF